MGGRSVGGRAAVLSGDKGQCGEGRRVGEHGAGRGVNALAGGPWTP